MKLLWFLIAWLSFILGFIGIFLPVLPTTPFFILSAFLFSKSSPRFHAWVLSLPIAGPGVRDWQENRVIKLKAKIFASLMILTSLCIIWLSSNIPLVIKIFVTLIMVSVNVFVVTRKTE